MTRYPVFAAGMTQPVNVCTLTEPQPEVEHGARLRLHDGFHWDVSLSFIQPHGAKIQQGGSTPALAGS